MTVPIYYMKSTGATATVVLMPGGGGGISINNGAPTSNNFLVRSRDHFVANGFNVAVMDRPNDQNELDYPFRVSPEHIQDLRRLVSYLKSDSGLPVWLVGTSRGTVSATAAAIAFGNDELTGIVLTASVTSEKKVGAVPAQRLDAIRIPVLVLHHEKDACHICSPADVPQIVTGLKNSPVKKLVMVNGGENPTGDPCKAKHWHGFVGMEKEAVDIIAGWIKKPLP